MFTKRLYKNKLNCYKAAMNCQIIKILVIENYDFTWAFGDEKI
jgi:hypothetical protein